MEEVLDEWTPPEVSKYKVGKLLGKGAKASVYIGTFEDSKVALKIVELEDLDIQNEINSMKKIGSQNDRIIKLLDVVQNPEYHKICLILEFLEGDLLNKIIPSNGIPEDQLIPIFKQILEAVSYCHSKMVAHRDLKPDNIIIDSKKQIKLFDFGFSRILAPGKFSRLLVGTMMYCAPEILNKERYIGPEVDVWSLGAILYTMVSGKLPFEGQTDGHIMQSIVNAEYIIPDNISKECRDLISKMMNKDPRIRITMNGALSHSWILGNDKAPTFPKFDKVDEKILKYLREYKFDEKKAVANILNDPLSEEYNLYSIFLNNQ